MTDYTTTLGSTADRLALTLTDANGPIDLTTADVITLNMRRSLDGELFTVDLTGSIDVAIEGTIDHAWQLADYPDAPGMYAAQIVVEFAQGTTLYVPNERVDGRLWYRFEFLPALG